MYQVGDKVVYPVHGAGVVVGIEQREVAGKSREYYILNLPYSGLKLSVPMNESGRLGLRALMSKGDTEQVLAILDGRDKTIGLPEKWSVRAKVLAEKIKAGDVCELAAVVHNLAEREKVRTLAGGERRIFEQAREILLSELKLAACDDEQVREKVGAAVASLEELR